MTTEDDFDKKLAEWRIQKDIEKQDIEQGITEPTREELLEKYNVWIKRYDKHGVEISKKVNFPNLGELIFNALGYHFFTTKDSEELYWYNGGYYETKGEQIIKDQVEYFLGENTTEHAKNEVTGYIRDKNYQDREIFSPDPNLINMQNGVYNIMIQEITEHSPDYYFLNEIPVIYDPKAKCPKITQFIKEVVYEQDIPVLQELFGYCLYRKYHIHKACMFLGGGRNGKSTTLSLLKSFLGEKNVSNKELQRLMYDKFGRKSLHGKLANIAPDISDKALETTGIFKALCGGDRVNADVKFKDDFDFLNTAKLIFSANKLPKSEDNSYAFFSRWILISYPNTFEGKNCDPYILDEITTPEELSGLFNRSIEGLSRLLSTGSFSYGKTVEEVMDQYKTMSDPVYAYCQEFLKCETGKHILKADLREHYVNWCKKTKLPIVPGNILTQELANHLPELRTGQPGGRGKRKPAYMNITWQENNGKNAEIDNFETNPCTDSTGGTD